MREHDAREPFAGPVGARGGEESRKRRRDRGPGPDEEAVAGVERDVREHELGLEGEEELQRLVIAQLSGGTDDHRHYGVLEGGLGVAGVANGGRETCGLASDGDPHQLPLAAEVAVERGPGASGLAGDVV